MKRNLLLIDLVLLALAVWLVLSFRSSWVQYQADHSLSRLNPSKEKSLSAHPSQPGQAKISDLSAIVEKHLFTPDRNNVVEPDPVEPEKKNTALKPLLTGILAFGDQEFALMISSEPKDNQAYKRLKIGDSLSGYRLVKILDQKVLMELDGSEVEIPISEPTHLVPRETGSPVAASSPGGGPKVAAVGSAPAPSSSGATTGQPTASNRRDDVPAGTVVNGKKKVVHPSPFGDIVLWVDAK